MSFSRNLRWMVLGLVGLLLVCAGLLWLRKPPQPAAAPPISNKEAKPVAKKVKLVGKVRRLEPEKPIEDELEGGEGHVFEVTAEAGQYLHVTADQRGIDVALQVLAPGRGSAFEVDSPTDDTGPEQFFAVPTVPGAWKITVGSNDETAPSGRYHIEVDSLRPVTADEKKHAEAWALFNDGEALRRKRTRESRLQALPKYRAALALWDEIHSNIWRAEAFHRIGWIHQDLTEYAEAIAALEKALPLYRAQKKRVDEGIVLNRIGDTQYRRGQWEDALSNHRAAAEIFSETRQTKLESEALSGVGNALNAMGKVEPALASYRAALEKGQGARSPLPRAIALAGMGDILAYQGKLEQAQDVLNDALRAFTEEGEKTEEARMLTGIANVDQRLKRFSEARTGLERALQIQEEVGDRVGQALTWNSLGTLHLLAKERDEAGGCYQKALSLFRERGNRPGEAFALLNLGRTACEKHDFRECLSYHEQAGKLFAELSHRRGEVSNLFGIARALSGLGDFMGSRQRLKEVEDRLESLRSEAENVDLRTSYLATRQHYYELDIDVLMHLDELHPGKGYDALALEVHERRRARGLLDQITASRVLVEHDTDAALLTREREIQDKVNALENTRAENEARRSRHEQIEAMEKEERNLLVQLEQVRTEIRSKNPRYAQLAWSQPLKLSEIQQKILGKSTVLLVYSLGEERSFLWCIPHEGKVITKVLPKRELIEQVARRVYREWSRAERRGDEASTGWAAWLSRELLGSVKEHLTTRRVLIVADGALEYLPFAALPDPRELPEPGQEKSGFSPSPLVKRHEIIYLPSVSVVSTLREEAEKARPARLKIAVIADPVFSVTDKRFEAGGGASPSSSNPAEPTALERSRGDLGLSSFESLPNTAEEARVIEELIPRQQRWVVTGFEATRENVLSSKLSDYQVLHFATHGILNPKHPELSGLVLSLVDEHGNPRQDGFLLAHEVCNLKLRADLAVLSACQTGLGEEIRGEGLVGLTRSFMYAGVPRMIVSLWNVNDKATAELMKRFYRCYFQEEYPASAALRCAQLSMMEDPRWRDPYYWAPFVFQGEWRRRGVLLEDDDIEARSAGTGTPGVPPDDYPPPRRLPGGCPKDLGKDH